MGSDQAHFLVGRADFQPGCPALHQKGAQALVVGAVRVRAGDDGENASMGGIGDIAFRAVQDPALAVPCGACADA